MFRAIRELKINVILQSHTYDEIGSVGVLGVISFAFNTQGGHMSRKHRTMGAMTQIRSMAASRLFPVAYSPFLRLCCDHSIQHWNVTDDSGSRDRGVDSGRMSLR